MVYNSKRLRLILYLFITVLPFYYIISINLYAKKPALEILYQNDSTEFMDINLTTLKYYIEEQVNENYLIRTPGCTIPDYSKTYKIVEAKYDKARSTCGTRAVLIEKISNEEIVFLIDEKKMKPYTKGKKYSCCYQFGYPAIVSGEEDYTQVRYTNCTNFKHKTKGELKTELITVTCALDSSKKRAIYEDAYIILKKLNKEPTEEQKTKKPWNVLVLGLDTVSRARVYSSLPKTLKYMLTNNWLDFRAYQKVGYNTFPNVVSLLTGAKLSTIYRTCSPGMDQCNHLMMWTDFKNNGFKTATGEEDLQLPDTFAKLGYKSSPTDHYMRPLFVTGEKRRGNIICTKMKPSGKNIIDYASTFAETYKDENFFGFFWSNSYSHNLENILTLIDNDLVNLFTKLNDTGVLNNTFIYFLSDHGFRSSTLRVPYESYYDERLPMFFMWVPTEFRESRPQEYNNLKINQNRLITPYDVYLTFHHTITISDSQPFLEKKSEACPNCTSIFNNISIDRTCEDAGVDEKWCSCHELVEISQKNSDVIQATNLAVARIQDKVSKVKTTHCMKCEMLKLKSILRSHTYRDEYRNNTYYVIAFVMSPADVAYEIKAVKHNETFTLYSENTISVYNVRGRCAIVQNERAYCVCSPSCKSHTN
ncbi:uncharacterized protein LOC128198002 [Bicyclus anynana]|uniref:Uncharacterized protein LOC128198002 n=1 Tax=Bicyclus anynana TaxID=110368 RepID=A0ABM3LEW3_BICAN|nr:uncharacterized protein LOC128198002 [Bicyclus anynana]